MLYDAALFYAHQLFTAIYSFALLIALAHSSASYLGL